MIRKLEINSVHMKIDPKLSAYINKKIGRLDRFVPRHARESMHATVILRTEAKKSTKNHTCEVIITVPADKITIKESTINMYAAVDIVEAKLKIALKKYKNTHNNKRIHRRVISRLKRLPFTAIRDDR
jgi:putative sigma-54 modulation protein